MQSFTYLSPTEVAFGKGTQDQTAAYVRKYGGTRVLLVYGGGSIVRSGLLGQVRQNLEEAGLPCREFGGAMPNPTLEHAREGIRQALDFSADFILGIGGGSAIDTAKAIAIGSANPQTDIWDFWCHKKNAGRALPTGAILTIPAAGSETSNSSVLTNSATGSKRGLSSDLNRPRFAIMNPELTYTLPVYQVACGVTDIMMHTLDRYFNPTDNELTDAIAEALLRTVIDKGRTAIQNPRDYDAMSELMWAGSLSHNGLTGLGGPGDFAVHQLGHELSAMFGTAHGASLSTIWDSWALAVCPEKPARFARYARNVWGLQNEDENALALAGIQATVAYFSELGMPVSFGTNPDIGIQSDETLRDLAYRCSFQKSRTIGTFRVLDEENIYKIYQAANQ
ncbi:iron-containing alcohol dehydrogenase [Clostridiaceae bacterium]|nr:iron-containing alcohol dehydrogenase [Clostridiaceae bacterium]RKI14388.1 iron-containing alcohol dehydrogenase [bacterium 1XD21-70]